MIEIRFHGRGGQGALTAARILASAFWKEKKYALVLPEFKSERRSAPIAVSVRVSQEPIILRSKINEPDYLVILDPSLLQLKEVKVLDGFKKNQGMIIISAAKEFRNLKDLHGCKVGIADMNLIARKYRLGHMALPATGAGILGALAKITNLITLESILGAMEESEELPKKDQNILAAKDAFHEAKILEIAGQEPVVGEKKNSAPKFVFTSWKQLPESVVSLGDTRNNLTGAWRKIRPYYEEKISPCKNACPLENEIPSWMLLLKQGKTREAWEKLIEKNPLPAVTGRVCPAFCERDCNRKEFDESISIRELEKFLGDQALKNDWHLPVPDNKEKHLSVAVVGSGPAGLSCTYQLARRGYRVNIFEQLPVLGGMMMVGIPDFRLPKDILGREIDNIVNLGMGVHKGVAINKKFLRYLEYAYDAVFLATGLQKSRKLNIPGEENNPNVLYGLDFLKDVNLGKKIILGQRVAVIGGGNTALDVARTAKRLGSEVSIFYRRSKAEMPAIASEIKEAETEGIKIQELVMPLRIFWKLVAFQETKLGEPDETGRKKFVPVEGSNFLEEFDKLIIAAGEEKDASFDGDPKKVFVVEDAGTIAQAIKLGRLAAESIYGHAEKQLKVVSFKDINTAYFEQKKRSLSIIKEAERCFSCGICDLCGNCWKFCPHMSVLEEKGELMINYDYCKGCGICFQECPKSVISQELEV